MAFKLALMAFLTLSTVAGQPSRSHNSYVSRRHHTRSRGVVKRQNFLHTTQPSDIGQGTATEAEGCTLWLTPSAGDSCLSIITYSPGLSLSDFLDLNPSLDASCSGLEIGVGYCIDTDDEHVEATGTVRQLVATKKSGCKTKKPTLTSGALKPTAAKQTGTSSSGTTSSGVHGVKNGLLNANSACGSSDSTHTISKDDGPNGRREFLNCGISKSDPTSGWNPPNITMDQIVYEDIDEDGIYAPCKDYLPLFKAAEKKHGIPAIFFAAFAMQESTCRPNASGDDGKAYGLMQITQDKCGGAPNGDCSDPAYNVETAAQYFVDQLASCNDNPLCAVGAYNGWQIGLTYQQATANQAPGSCCECQNNLDYMIQYFNAWIQNKNGYDYKYYDNLAVCEQVVTYN